MTKDTDHVAMRAPQDPADRRKPEDSAEWHPAQRALAGLGLGLFGLIWLFALPFCAIWFAAAWMMRKMLSGLRPGAPA